MGRRHSTQNTSPFFRSGFGGGRPFREAQAPDGGDAERSERRGCPGTDGRNNPLSPTWERARVRGHPPLNPLGTYRVARNPVRTIRRLGHPLRRPIPNIRLPQPTNQLTSFPRNPPSFPRWREPRTKPNSSVTTPFVKRRGREMAHATPLSGGCLCPSIPLSLDGCFAQLTSFPRRRALQRTVRPSRMVWQTGTRRLFGLVTTTTSSCAIVPRWKRARVTGPGGEVAPARGEMPKAKGADPS